MASSINASTTAGLVNTADTSGVLNIQTAGVTAISIDASQAVSFTNSPTVTGGTANGVAYLNGSKVLTTGSGLVFDGTNLGVGVTPSAWQVNNRAIQLLEGYASISSNNSQGCCDVAFNCFNGGSAATSGWKYTNTGVAVSLFQQQAGAFKFLTAPSGTAGNAISFTQAMTLNASGNLGITETSPTAKLHISVASAVVDGTKGVKITNPGGTAVMFECGVSGDSFIGTTSGSDFNIRTGNTVRATFDNAGNLLVGKTSTSSTTQGAYISSAGQYVVAQPAGTGAVFFQNTSGGATVGTITINASTTTYGTSSDYRLKENIVPMVGALSAVSALKPVTYNWKIDGSDGQGFIAHELAEVCPEAVQGKKDAVDDEGNPVYQGIDTSFLVATLTAAIQEMKAIIDTQASTITQLQADVALLKGA